MNIQAPEEALLSALRRYRELAHHRIPPTVCKIQLEGRTTSVPQLTFGDRRFVFVDANETATPSLIGQALRATRPESFNEENVLEIVVAVSGIDGHAPHTNAGLGVRVEPLHSALARLLRLPDGWRKAQNNALEQTLRPVLHQGQSRAVALLAKFEDGDTTPIPAWVDGFLSWERHDLGKSGKLVYLRAEAGKGKSTTLASLVHSRLRTASGPLPLFVPLRDLERGAGISWSGIAERLGVVEADAEQLALAIQSGLVLLVLDGLDEVSGRHNPTVVKQVVDLIVRKTLTKDALVAISGRTTEGAYIDSAKAVDVSLELPDVDDPSFSEFVSLVIDDITPIWDSVAERLPEPILEKPAGERGVDPPTDSERRQIRDWIRAAFDVLGKDRSLFFVQGLACIGRSRQLCGNRPLIIRSRVQAIPSTFDVCILAASLACVREQGKVDAIAEPLFTPGKQLDLLTLFALMASTSSGAVLPTPNELTRRVFELDTTHQNEEFSAIVHQMQKHALLFSSRSEGAAGDWKPTFLSEWVRNALVVRAWRDRERLEALLGGAYNLSQLVARAREARLAYHEILPSLETNVEQQRGILDALRTSSAEGSPEATTNFWAAVSAMADDPDLIVPTRIPELTDFSGLAFEGVRFEASFSGAYVVLTDTEFVNCEFVGCSFTESDFSGARFQGCQFQDVSFNACSGTALFDACQLERVTFFGSRARREPAWLFVDSRLAAGTRISQPDPIVDGAYLKACNFVECVAEESAQSILSGGGLGLDPRRVTGLEADGGGSGRAAEHQCLRSMLKTFFPFRVGEGEQRQARRYIRSSALGRGVLPAGSPSQAELLQILEAEGFTTGGRAGHIYAPWSSVVGGGDDAIVFRTELMEYMQSKKEGATVKRMLERIRRAANWK